ncbi:hypothetical protein SDRG_08595 [Saprolegnia diclina VS20]|uniref:Mbre TPR repeat protein n=1 Tax=Saprolegnia diclina (strain VS20) TaxID=1156394 RepID=T0QJJ4_SAPDV|nr:hypothetical protein SDRG_08595 [Saprolegnia diclina VS20]EQC33915.1 hypothetical protein SDRG_08595 [Saprolegnia diclina VS20]|eukprot:XP_008612710.1 hypothetical protein SDRG_08595 [Saprolegnia diclina VS20]
MATPQRPLGLELSYFRRFIELHGGRRAFEGKTSAQVCFDYVVPYTSTSEESLVEHVRLHTSDAACVQPANWYISHAWGYIFLEALESLELFFRERSIHDPVVWFCVFNNNQHRASEHPFAWWQSTFQESLAAIGNVVMIMHPWKNPVTLTRSWCIFEVYVTVMAGANFDVALAPNQATRFFDDILTDMSAFYKMLANVSSEAAQATVPTDKTNIDRVVTSSVGFTGLDRLVLETFEAWMKRVIRGRAALASTALEKARLLKALAEFVSLNGALAEGEAVGTEALALYLEAVGPDDPATLYMQGLLAMFQGHQYKPRDLWEPTLVDVMRRLTVLLGPLHEETLNCMYQLGMLYAEVLDQIDHGLELLGETLSRMVEVYGPDHPRTIDTRLVFTMFEAIRSQNDNAVNALATCNMDAQRVMGKDHPTALTGATFLSLLRSRAGGSHSDLLATDIATVERHERIFGRDHVNTHASILNLATTCLHEGDYDQALALLKPLVVNGDGPLDGARRVPRAMAQRVMAAAYEKIGECALAVDAWEAAIDGFRHVNAKDDLAGSVWSLYWARHKGDLWPTLACIETLLAHLKQTELLHEGWGSTMCLACELPMLEGITYICPGCTIDLGVVCASCHALVPDCLDCERSVLLPTEPPARALLKMRVQWLAKEGPSDALRAASDALAEYCRQWDLPLEDPAPQRVSTPLERLTAATSSTPPTPCDDPEANRGSIVGWLCCWRQRPRHQTSEYNHVE